MERLYTPWRIGYVSGERPANQGCVFCCAAEPGGGDEASPADSLVVLRAARTVVVANLYPYNSGHVMIAPRRHIARLAEATREELSEMTELAQRLEAVLTEEYRPDGINVGMNLGRVAGAGIADHMHMHVVPRWTGDTSFMGVVAETRVIPEVPQRSAERLRERLGRQR